MKWFTCKDLVKFLNFKFEKKYIQFHFKLLSFKSLFKKTGNLIIHTNIPQNFDHIKKALISFIDDCRFIEMILRKLNGAPSDGDTHKKQQIRSIC